MKTHHYAFNLYHEIHVPSEFGELRFSSKNFILISSDYGNFHEHKDMKFLIRVVPFKDYMGVVVGGLGELKVREGGKYKIIPLPHPQFSVEQP